MHLTSSFQGALGGSVSHDVFKWSDIFTEFAEVRYFCTACFKELPDPPNHPILEASGLTTP